VGLIHVLWVPDPGFQRAAGAEDGWSPGVDSTQSRRSFKSWLLPKVGSLSHSPLLPTLPSDQAMLSSCSKDQKVSTLPVIQTFKPTFKLLLYILISAFRIQY
jgi:hypothetical protein